MHGRSPARSRSRLARLAVAAGLTVAMASGGVLAGSGVASASPIVLGSCATSVQGAPGTPVELSPSAVVQPITNLIKAIPLLGSTLAGSFQGAFDALPPIPIGAIPSSGGGSISGAQVANAVVAQLDKMPLLGPVIGTLAGEVQSTLTSMCGVGVSAINTAGSAAQSGTAAVAGGSRQLQQSLGLAPAAGSPGSGGGAPSQGGSGGSGGGASQLPASNSPVVGGVSPDFSGMSWPDQFFGSATSPFDRYSGIPFATAGLFAPSPGVRYGGDVPGYSPGYGVLGQDSPNGVQNAGHAETLGGFGALPGGVGLPMLLAVLALSGVTAALVRTWVLRRIPVA